MKERKYTEIELESLRLAPGETISLREPGRLIGKAALRGRNQQLSINWIFRFYSPTHKKEREIGCGTWRPGSGMKTIRAARDKALLQIANNLDPLDEKQAERLAGARRLEEEKTAAQIDESEHLPVDSLFNDWLKDGPNQADNNATPKWRYNKHIKPALGEIEVRELSDRDITALLKSIVARGNNRTAETVHDDIRACLKWGEQRKPWRRLLIEGNPAALVKLDRIIDEDYQDFRERVLPDDEILMLYKAFTEIRDDYENAPTGTKYQATRPVPEKAEIAVWIMLSTLCRVGELSKGEWPYLSFEEKTWFIPREHVKKIKGGQHKAILIHLSDFALKWFRRLHKLTGHTQYFFPSERGEEEDIGHINEKQLTRIYTDRQTQFSKSEGKSKRRQDNSLVIGGERWTSHDLRRTGATMMQSLGIDPAVIDRCQNHALASERENGQRRRGGVRRHYLHYQYSPEMRAAWNALGARLEQILGGATQ